MSGRGKHGSFVATGMLPKADLEKLTSDGDDQEEDSSNHSTGSAPPLSTHRDLDPLSQSTPVLPTSKSPYPAILLYKTKLGSIMRYSTLDDSIRSTAAPRAKSTPDAKREIHLSQSDSAAMRSTTEAAKGLVSRLKGNGDDGVVDNDDAEGVQKARLPRNRSVVFGNLEIREYSRTIGCNPSVSGGPPVGLDWSYDPDHLCLDLEEYETNRGPRRSYAEMAMPRSVRTQLLTEEWKVTRPEMASAIRDANRIKQSRRRTVNNLDTPLEKASYQVEKAKRNTGRVLRGKKTARQEYEKWKASIISQWERWAAERVIEEENKAAAAEADADQTAIEDGATSGLVIDEDEALNLSEHSRSGPLRKELTASS